MASYKPVPIPTIVFSVPADYSVEMQMHHRYAFSQVAATCDLLVRARAAGGGRPALPDDPEYIPVFPAVVYSILRGHLPDIGLDILKFHQRDDFQPRAMLDELVEDLELQLSGFDAFVAITRAAIHRHRFVVKQNQREVSSFMSHTLPETFAHILKGSQNPTFVEAFGQYSLFYVGQGEDE